MATYFFASNVGELEMEIENGNITRMYFIDSKSSRPKVSAPEQVRTSLERYFTGDAYALHDLSIAPEGTHFQQLVWKKLRQIRYGMQSTYQELAQRMGSPHGYRAVASACRANPILLIIPCHRVLRKNGSLAGYSGGIARKRRLIDHESGATMDLPASK